tara:strand:- start:607 stop:1371 length:765 start_codon:yes stop_codon:yes gene_type:complete
MYRFVIPSWKRPTILRDKTLAFLKQMEVPKELIDIVVETEVMKTEYLEHNPGYNVVVSNTFGIMGKRNFVRTYYQYKTDLSYIVCIDDDIDMLMDWDVPMTADRFYEVIEESFIQCEMNGATMWGVSPFHNTFFMKNNITTCLKYICGAFFGLIIDRDHPPLQTDYDHYEDFDFSCQHFLRDKALIRNNGVSIITKYFNPNGGITEWYGGKEQRKEAQKQDALRFIEQYPRMARIIEKPYGTDLRLNHLFKSTI